MISFQEFKNKLLEPGLVDKIGVSNRSVAKVYVKNTPRNANETDDEFKQVPVNANSARRNISQYKFYFNIGSVESFEEKLEEAQEALGIDPHDYIPITYASEVNWFQELMRFAPTALIFGVFWFMGRRMQGGIGVGGPGGRDVARCDEAKQEIMEFVHFLKNPKKYEDLVRLGAVSMPFMFSL
ncbi:hypothetical protein Patl1_16217 [Pistacia atlantica]|uniref:Uncharacterized protein n=1 Tax=Pistacia atlantica TaxID=434234 RepID=A0ACC1B803_9ROSI|nr:hypothetical protein Patl1_16217 [Pistacia atlantica]